jgi:hypothetical protein
MTIIFRASPEDEDLRCIAAALGDLDHYRTMPATAESSSLRRSAYVELFDRVGALPEGRRKAGLHSAPPVMTTQLFRASPDDADLRCITEAVEALDRCRHVPVTDESESKSRAAYVDVLQRVGDLPEGGEDFYEKRRVKAPNGNGNGNGNGHSNGRMGPITRLTR